MSLSHDQILRLARLARLSVQDGEVEAVAARLNRVIDLVDELRQVDTAGVEPMAHALDLVQRLRADAVAEEDRHALYQSVAPAVQEDLYLVPKVIE